MIELSRTEEATAKAIVRGGGDQVISRLAQEVVKPFFDRTRTTGSLEGVAEELRSALSSRADAQPSEQKAIREAPLTKTCAETAIKAYDQIKVLDQMLSALIRAQNVSQASNLILDASLLHKDTFNMLSKTVMSSDILNSSESIQLTKLLMDFEHKRLTERRRGWVKVLEEMGFRP